VGHYSAELWHPLEAETLVGALASSTGTGPFFSDHRSSAIKLISDRLLNKKTGEKFSTPFSPNNGAAFTLS
jgi:hypothetical protein